LLRELAQARAAIHAIQTLAGQVEAQQTAQLNQMSQARRDPRLSDLSGMIPTNELLRMWCILILQPHRGHPNFGETRDLQKRPIRVQRLKLCPEELLGAHLA